MKYTKERHIVFQEADVMEILVEYLKRKGEKAIPPADEIEFSYDEFKHGNEITLMFDDITEPNLEDIWQAELEELRYDDGDDKGIPIQGVPKEDGVTFYPPKRTKGTNNPGGSYPGNIGG